MQDILTVGFEMVAVASAIGFTVCLVSDVVGKARDRHINRSVSQSVAQIFQGSEAAEQQAIATVERISEEVAKIMDVALVEAIAPVEEVDEWEAIGGEVGSVDWDAEGEALVGLFGQADAIAPADGEAVELDADALIKVLDQLEVVEVPVIVVSPKVHDVVVPFVRPVRVARESDFSGMTVKQLRSACRDQGLKAKLWKSAKKEVLLGLLAS